MLRLLSILIGGTILSATQAAALDPCRLKVEIKEHTSLEEASSTYFGDTSYASAILLATNARAGKPGFSFLGNADARPLAKIANKPNLCIPNAVEALALKNRYEIYLDAVADMSLANPSEVVNDLDPVPATGPATVVSWIRADQAKAYSGMAAGDTFNVRGATWVTLAPHLQEFCGEYTKNHSSEASAVTLRLEQRLGLAPNSSKTHFLISKVQDPQKGKTIFRPCGDTEVTDRTCKLAPPSCTSEQTALQSAQSTFTANPTAATRTAFLDSLESFQSCDATSDFFYKQYYGSYGQAHPIEFPWTSLGYTFDWGPGDPKAGHLEGFVVVGESEYVIPAGTQLSFVELVETAEYCRADG